MKSFRTSFRTRIWLVLGSLGFFAAVALGAYGSMTTQAKPEVGGRPAVKANVLDVMGRTQCLLTKKCTIAPVPLHPVTEVLVEPGARVKKDQVLVKLDDDEPQADVRAKQAALENAQVVLTEARRFLAQTEAAYQKGAVPEQRYHEARVGALKAEMDERTAKALLDSAKAELEHYDVQAQIEGVISWIEVHPGMVSRPGTTVWGEILDLRELDVRCEVALDQVDQLKIGQTAEIRKVNKDDVLGSAKILYVGIAVDKKSGSVPVMLRLANPDGRLRCDETVRVHFTVDPASDQSK